MRKAIENIRFVIEFPLVVLTITYFILSLIFFIISDPYNYEEKAEDLQNTLDNNIEKNSNKITFSCILVWCFFFYYII